MQPVPTLPPQHQESRWLIYTDLDGTLLDHDSYDFSPARPALTAAREAGIPIIPVTSKTLAELERLYRQMDLDGPCVAENGSLIAVPEGYFPSLDEAPRWGRWRILHLGWTYAEIIEQLDQLRTTHGFRFLGFNDLRDVDVAWLTGLTRNSAALARKRQATEPLIWQGSEEERRRFAATLQTHGLQLVRGGRFWHVMTLADKGTAIQRLTRLYQKRYAQAFFTVALGDSPNDLSMLAAADCPLVIRRKDGTCMSAEELNEAGIPSACCTDAIGPTGWNEAVNGLLAIRVAAAEHGVSMNATFT